MTESAVNPFTDDESRILAANGDAAWWDDPEADEVEGYDLLRDEALLDLIGVPFRGFRAVYRDGVQRKGVAYRDDYVSLELRIAPPAVVLRDIARIQSRRKTFDAPVLSVAQAASLPGQQLVINDGSTGIYRQITQYLVAKEHIKLPDGPEEGEKGESIYDLPRSEWLEGADQATEGIGIRLNCTRGLRFSEYPSKYLPEGEMAKTWYIA
jgi:hypothetical protein